MRREKDEEGKGAKKKKADKKVDRLDQLYFVDENYIKTRRGIVGLC